MKMKQQERRAYRRGTIVIGRCCTGRDYWLSFGVRVRFGTRKEIASDVRHIRFTGGLPASKAHLIY